MADQFQPHTPSFGDDEFDIGSLGLMGHGVPVMADQQHQQQQQAIYQQAEQPQYGMYNPHMDAGGGGYTLQTIGSPTTTNQMQPRYSPPQQHQQGTLINLECRTMTDVDMHNRISATTMAPPSWTGPQQQQHVMAGQVNTSPLGSNVSATPPSGDTSEESGDDCHSNVHLIGASVANKRPSPEPLEANGARAGQAAVKKAKVTQQKKKKRRDPHEPQKPVSAYALFFRDTQAAIKGQNPNASFGEVSKIVASMWDALDTDSKNVYKKKTEAAKKEYLKALAAYRASVVSKEGNGQQGNEQPPGGNMYQAGNAAQQQQQPAQQQQQQHNYPVNNYQGQYNIPQQQQQQQYTASMAVSSAPTGQPMSPKKSLPLLNSLMTEQQQQLHLHHQQQMQQQQQQNMMAYSMNNRPAYMNQPQQMMQQQQQANMNYPTHVMQQQPQQQQQQQQQQQRVMNPALSKPQVNSNGLQHPHCIRNGCPNAAIPSPDWENEYCSNECVVNHCRDVFSAWVASGQGAPPGYPPPVK